MERQNHRSAERAEVAQPTTKLNVVMRVAGLLRRGWIAREGHSLTLLRWRFRFAYLSDARAWSFPGDSSVFTSEIATSLSDRPGSP